MLHLFIYLFFWFQTRKFPDKLSRQVVFPINKNKSGLLELVIKFEVSKERVCVPWRCPRLIASAKKRRNRKAISFGLVAQSPNYLSEVDSFDAIYPCLQNAVRFANCVHDNALLHCIPFALHKVVVAFIEPQSTFCVTSLWTFNLNVLLVITKCKDNRVYLRIIWNENYSLSYFW